MPAQPGTYVTQGMIAKQKERSRREKQFRQQADAYLESQGLLAYQNKDLTPEQLQQRIEQSGIFGVPTLKPTPPVTNYTVKAGDTLGTISANTGLSVDTLLASNPDMQTPQTGMVLNTPVKPPPMQSTVYAGTPSAAPVYKPPPSQATAFGQGGAPNNAAYGSMTTNPQGTNASTIAPPSVTFFQPKGTQYQAPNFFGSAVLNPLNPAAPMNIGTLNAPIQTAPKPPTQTALKPPTQPQLSTSVQTPASVWRAGESAMAAGRSRLGTQTPRPKTNWETSQMLQTIQTQLPSNTPYLGSGGTFRFKYKPWGTDGGGGGGDGNRISYPTTTPGSDYIGNNAPAFSSSAGFRGLVNWRI